MASRPPAGSCQYDSDAYSDSEGFGLASEAITRGVRHRRGSPRGKLQCNAYVPLQTGRAGRKAHYAKQRAG